MNRKKETTTDRLEEILEQSGADRLSEYLSQEKVFSSSSNDLFGEYVKSLLREKGFKQKDVFYNVIESVVKIIFGSAWRRI